MARPVKQGLDYFPFDVNFYRDKKIKILRARHGPGGVEMYQYLLCEIYSDKGYYLKVDDDLEYIISDDLNMSIGEVKQVLNFLLERSLFNDTLFKSDKVLTSARIQRTYQEAVKGRASKNPIEIEGYWLLNSKETRPFIKLNSFIDKSENNNGFSEKNTDLSQEQSLNKKKEKERKEKEKNINNAGAYFQNPELNRAFIMYINKRNSDGAKLSLEQIELLKKELDEIGKDDPERIAIANKAFISSWKSFYPIQGKRSAGKPNSFNNFHQRQYDYESLEKELLKK